MNVIWSFIASLDWALDELRCMRKTMHILQSDSSSKKSGKRVMIFVLVSYDIPDNVVKP